MSDNDTPNSIPQKPAIPGAKPVIPGVTPAGAPPRATSRITPPGMEPLPAADNTTRTVRLKPITTPPPVTAPPSITAPIPGADPIPDGPRPPTPAQVQAAKSKTSRISLEQAISMDSQTPRATQQVEPANVLAAPAPGAAPRTIRLKRPTEMPTLKVNAVPPPSPLPGADEPATLPTVAEAAPDPDSSVTQKRTLKVRRPGAPSIAIGGAAPAKEPDALPEGMTPIADNEMTPLVHMAPPEKGNAVFLVFAIFAILVTASLIALFAFQLFGEKAVYFRFTV